LKNLESRQDRRVQTGSRTHPAFYPMGTRGSYAGCKAAGARSRPLTSMQRQVQEYVDPYLHSTCLDGMVLNNNGKIVLWNAMSRSLLIVINISEAPATSIFRTGDGTESHDNNVEFYVSRNVLPPKLLKQISIKFCNKRVH
jgi:hypothetical protein